MKEEFLHYLWKNRLYDPASLLDDEGNRISVIHPGEHNHDSGPDFFNARIKTGGTEWAGNVEIHVRSSHFDLHGHGADHAFDNVILHVVAENDRKVFNSKGEELLTVAIRFDEGYLEKYCHLLNDPDPIACHKEIATIDRFYLQHWLHALLIERLAMKSEAIARILDETGNDWDETFYRLLARYFGFRVNTEPFEMLATAIPFRIIRKHADNRFQIEALLFGTAGMLDEGLFREALNDDYFRELALEYRILSAKYTLKPIPGWLWKFSRLRPVNFPTIRLSQLAQMLSLTGGLFSRTLEATGTGSLKDMFGTTASVYWDTHYVFGKKSPGMIKNTGSQAIDIFLMNAVIPVIFVFGRIRDDRRYCERALDFLGELGPETNSVVTLWKECGIQAGSAYDTQALLQLTEEYCRKRKCLECRIGSRLVSQGKDPGKDRGITP